MNAESTPTPPVDSAKAASVVAQVLGFLIRYPKAAALIRMAVVLVCGRQATVDDSTLSIVASVAVTAAMYGWSWYEKHQHAKALAAAQKAVVVPPEPPKATP